MIKAKGKAVVNHGQILHRTRSKKDAKKVALRYQGEYVPPENQWSKK